jgi:alanine racemase
MYSLEALKGLQELLAQQKKQMGVHIEIDTGMNRLGIDPDEVGQMIDILKASEWICVNGIYSHLACAEDEAEDAFNRKQLDQFNAIAAKAESALSIKTIKHVRNSAGTLRYPKSPTDMVRLGIGIYGVDSNNLYQKELKNISALKTVVSQVRTVKQGETIGYNRTFKADKDMTVATIAIGYADGFKRLFSNGTGKVIINNRLALVVGRVNMDMTMVDVSSCEAKEGNEVIIFDDNLKPTYLAKLAGTIPYEIFTSIGERVRRSYLLEIE